MAQTAMNGSALPTSVSAVVPQTLASFTKTLRKKSKSAWSLKVKSPPAHKSSSGATSQQIEALLDIGSVFSR